MAGPDRVVVDIHAASAIEFRDKRWAIPVGDKRVKRVRLGRARPDTVRVVLDLEASSPPATFEVSKMADTNGLQIEVRGETAPLPSITEPAAPLDPPPPQPEPEPQAPPPPPPAQEPKPQEAAPPVPPVRPFELPARVGISGETPLTLDEALYQALANNQEIQALRIDNEETGHRINGARGVYIPNFNALTLFEKQTLPVSSSLSGSNTGAVTNKWWQSTPELSGSLPRFGGSYAVSFFNQRYTTNDLFATLNPQYPTALNVQFTQPLWRYLHYDQNRYAIEVARKNQDLTSETFKRRVMEIIRKTEQAYWELSFARRDLATQLEALDIARKQDEANRRQLELGQLAPIEIVAAQTQLANFEIAVYSAQENLTRAENTLKALILGDRSAAMWSTAINPTTPPETVVPTASLADATTEAIATRPESAEVRIAGGINQAELRLNRERLKPQVDLMGSYTGAGLAGRQVVAANPLGDSLTNALIRINQLSYMAGLPAVVLGPSATTPGFLIGSYGQSLSTIGHNDFPTWLVQLRISMPLSNRVARSNVELSLAEGRRLDLRKHSVEQTIEADVRNAMQSIDSARQRLQAARVKRQSAEEQYRSEERRFTRGASTLFLVQQRQLNMVTSMSQVHRAETDLSEAIAAYELALGSNYKRHNVTIK
jgi:HAE1 family hydrophobic/amphiphilic exporter-1